MGTLAALLGTIGQVGASAGKAKEELAAEELKKKQIYDQLESSALNREALRKEIELMGKKVEPDIVAQQKEMERVLGRPMTDIEKERFLKVAPKETPGKVATKLIQDPASKTGWSFVSYDPISGIEYSRQLDAPPQRGLIESETTTTDPLTGLKTVSHRKPILGTKAGAALPSPVAPQAPAPPSGPVSLQDLMAPPARPQMAGKKGAKALLKKPQPAQVKPQPTSAGRKPLPLDPDGHIPATTAKLSNPYVVETANELLDGIDVKQVRYPKLVPVAAQLARRFGWEQGKFTPKEQVMLRETTNFIQRAMQDDSMKALDEGTASRLQLQQLAMNPDKEGYIGRGLSVLSARNMSDSQKNFIQTYNQLVGTISGLAQLVRSGRATEATIERLKTELPNPSTTRDSKDAHERLQRLMDEINVAMQKGTFTGPDSGSTGAQSIIDKALNPGGK
jgi:hypothetical protein